MLDSPNLKGKRLGVAKNRSQNLSNSRWVAFAAMHFDKRWDIDWLVDTDNHRSHIHKAQRA